MSLVLRTILAMVAMLLAANAFFQFDERVTPFRCIVYAIGISLCLILSQLAVVVSKIGERRNKRARQKARNVGDGKSKLERSSSDDSE